MTYLLMIPTFLVAIFLIILVLLQRGRGGGLAGALGGMGGQSAFGTKAGDLFTRITIGVAAVWIVLCVASIKVFNAQAGTSSVIEETEFGANAPTGDSANKPGAAGGTTKPRPGAAVPRPDAGGGEQPSGESSPPENPDEQ